MNLPLARCNPRFLPLALAAVMFSCHLTLCAQTMPQSAAGTDDERPALTPSESLTVTLNGRSTQFSTAELASMPQTTVTVHNPHSNADERYTGVALAELFHRLGLPQQHGPGQANLLHSYLRAQGTDNYFAIFSAVEVDRELHKGDVLVGLQRNGQPLARDGRFMLVSTEDALPMRSVRNLISLTLSTVN